MSLRRKALIDLATIVGLAVCTGLFIQLGNPLLAGAFFIAMGAYVATLPT